MGGDGDVATCRCSTCSTRRAVTLSLTPVLGDQLEAPGVGERFLRSCATCARASHALDADGCRAAGPSLAAELERAARRLRAGRRAVRGRSAATCSARSRRTPPGPPRPPTPCCRCSRPTPACGCSSQRGRRAPRALRRAAWRGGLLAARVRARAVAGPAAGGGRRPRDLRRPHRRLRPPARPSSCARCAARRACARADRPRGRSSSSGATRGYPATAAYRDYHHRTRMTTARGRSTARPTTPSAPPRSWPRATPRTSSAACGSASPTAGCASARSTPSCSATGGTRAPCGSPPSWRRRAPGARRSRRSTTRSRARAAPSRARAAGDDLGHAARPVDLGRPASRSSPGARARPSWRVAAGPAPAAARGPRAARAAVQRLGLPGHARAGAGPTPRAGRRAPRRAAGPCSLGSSAAVRNLAPSCDRPAAARLTSASSSSPGSTRRSSRAAWRGTCASSPRTLVARGRRGPRAHARRGGARRGGVAPASSSTACPSRARPRDLDEFVAWVEHMNADMLAAGRRARRRATTSTSSTATTGSSPAPADRLARALRVPVPDDDPRDRVRPPPGLGRQAPAVLHPRRRDAGWPAAPTASSPARTTCAATSPTSSGSTRTRVTVIPNGIDPLDLQPVDDLDALRARFAAPRRAARPARRPARLREGLPARARRAAGRDRAASAACASSSPARARTRPSSSSRRSGSG